MGTIKKLNSKGQSTVVAEMLMIVIVVILATTFVVSLQTNVSFYVKSKELTSIYLWTTKNDQTINLTAIHSGGDPTAISGHISVEYQNGTSQNIEAQLTYNSTTTVVTGDFELSLVKFGEQFQLTIDKTQLGTNGTIHYLLNSKNQILAEVDEKI